MVMDKILYIHPYNNYTGSTKVLADILKSKYSRLNDVTVITETSQEGFLSGLKLNLINVPILRYNNRAIPVLSAIVWVIVGFLKTLFYIRKYDVVYINTILPGFAALAARLYGKKVIYHVHEIYIKKNPKSLFGEFIFNHVKAHRIFVSNYIKAQYTLKIGCTSEVMYNKLGNDFINLVKCVPVELHTRNHILMLATLQKGKGLDIFVEVANRLPKYIFTLVISSPKEDINRLFKVSIPNNLTIYPKQSNVHQFYYNADFIVNLSNPEYIIETFGLTIMEGMAYGLPAIVPNAGGPMEVIEDGITGYSIDVSNVDEVVRYILKCSEKQEYARLYQNALNRVELFKYSNIHE